MPANSQRTHYSLDEDCAIIKRRIKKHSFETIATKLNTKFHDATNLRTAASVRARSNRLDKIWDSILQSTQLSSESEFPDDPSSLDVALWINGKIVATVDITHVETSSESISIANLNLPSNEYCGGKIRGTVMHTDV